MSLVPLFVGSVGSWLGRWLIGRALAHSGATDVLCEGGQPAAIRYRWDIVRATTCLRVLSGACMYVTSIEAWEAGSC